MGAGRGGGRGDHTRTHANRALTWPFARRRRRGGRRSTVAAPRPKRQAVRA
jgi:hypothetical protein